MALNSYRMKRSADGSTIWLTLPREEWREIEGGCACEYCSDNGKSQSPAYWDTLSIPAKEQKHSDYPYQVHYPELHGAKPKPKVMAAEDWKQQGGYKVARRVKTEAK